ncbi:uncharacterized protein B0P05DRAFT_588957 [Gilbertella persicaria]|uniref:uncharacterized protein n=1 Tax=Gilbertella persicaria TaxID=101096 RepID=UPI0022205D4D|nr:uncharacterized protein B0P05DRAFT_588957 [Gilbertella persicaria]KAI8071102.1 hypothetical protein B0P05DRAFT_588957 [Gilbertella persicaria]
MSSSIQEPSFRTTVDDELTMGDDSDAPYEHTLMQSGLLDWLHDAGIKIPQQRLQMLLEHLTHKNK